jgi:hypothetical protein
MADDTQVRLDKADLNILTRLQGTYASKHGENISQKVVLSYALEALAEKWKVKP